MLRKKRKPEETEIIVLVDIENLQASFQRGGPKGFSLTAGFDKTLKRIAREVGRIYKVYVFSPPHLILLLGEELYNLRFTIIACPKVHTKDGGTEVDTVDHTLIEFGKEKIGERRSLTHLCIASGDRDFAPLVREAIQQGLKVLVIASSPRSLSAELIRLADEVYPFSPTEQ